MSDIFELFVDLTHFLMKVISAVKFEQLLMDVEQKIKEMEEIDKSSALTFCPIVLVEGILVFHFK